MHRLSIEELKKNQLEILDVVMSFCEANGIKCWLNGGTLLGAVRHKGYIPWDDDIDLGMLRPEYDKFMSSFNDYNPRYKIISIENDPDSPIPYGKVLDNETVLYEPDEKGIKLAVNIDIFVMDNAPDDDSIVQEMFRKRDSYYAFRNRWYTRRLFDPVNGNLFRRLCAYAFRLLWKIIRLYPFKHPISYYSKKIIENSKRYINENAERIGDFTGRRKAVCRKEAFTSLVELEFEGKKYKAPSGYDEWLTQLYGDYMQLPPSEKQVSDHNFKAYILD